MFNSYYLPNVYFSEDRDPCVPMIIEKQWIDMACFGSIRPLKNQLIQAIAALNFAYNNNHTLHFHINSSRVEQSGDSVLKNIRALFDNTIHKLIEHSWMSHHDFLKVIAQMDLGLQVSLSESFNIISGDFVTTEVPIIVSPDVSWMPRMHQVDPTNAKAIEEKIESVLEHRTRYIRKATAALRDYNSDSLEVWSKFLNVK